MSNGRHRVVVVGGGFGGLNATRYLKDAPVDVTIVDRTNHHLFQPLLYQVAAGLISPGLIAPAIRATIKKQRNARALLGEVKDLDLANKVVKALGPDGRPLDLEYDSLVVAAGASHSYFGKDEFAEFAPGMKTIEDARYLRDGILSKFEMAEMATDPVERAEWLTFVVIGAGPTGVELAGQLAELAHLVLPQEYRTVDTTEARIILLEGAPAVLPPFDEKLQKYTKAHLEKMGVEIRVNTLATDMNHESITVKGPNGVETIRARTRIWAAGVQASPLAKMLAEKTGAELDRAGRVSVNPDCSLPGHPEVFAIGDMVSLNKLPGVAQPAMQEGKYVAKLIKARTTGAPIPPPFKYFDKGSMATIGHKAAVADAFGYKFTGFIAYLMWGFIHVAYLVGWGNRLGTLYNWAHSLWFSKSRGHRIITFERTMVELDENRKKGRAPVVLPGSKPSLADEIDAAEGAPKTA
ncbi:NAD(P)/FAD-dependent oxidoreductase [Nakamurella multipartita]|uniref:NADH:ubiquinone reductase (non-electrogenic) n=1 Tax=Nakamurella multipartita (strain ATCC 700099 / DSM 44233 / CIP 104796 / JCM 9543 / NBRC 105858 / Y-104) TaxID=479431 RepID=C8XA35_NAKMY|nr:NAD(P)/FAD-dependent oxidoreductase [Nakamurella multipartita]ACV81235.1 FAD-dependent pyridine nucleotide-disulfide oxidoreductase [Nakamurella multipartita DSM 44233]